WATNRSNPALAAKTLLVRDERPSGCAVLETVNRWQTMVTGSGTLTTGRASHPRCPTATPALMRLNCAVRLNRRRVPAGNREGSEARPCVRGRFIHDDINPGRRVRGPGLQDNVGRLPSRGGIFGVMSIRRNPVLHSSRRRLSLGTDGVCG